MIFNDRTERAVALALHAHAGQKDKKGLPVIFHPIHVMLQMDTESSRIVAVLHDVLEDTDFTLEDIDEMVGLNPVERDALIALTHHKHEPYSDYIKRVKAAGHLAVKVKLADIAHNSSEERLADLPEVTVDRLLRKYATALEILAQWLYILDEQ
jgi:(p)ppGpp synthase/HD superfamily hydrolase